MKMTNNGRLCAAQDDNTKYRSLMEHLEVTGDIKKSDRSRIANQRDCTALSNLKAIIANSQSDNYNRLMTVRDIWSGSVLTDTLKALKSSGQAGEELRRKSFKNAMALSYLDNLLLQMNPRDTAGRGIKPTTLGCSDEVSDILDNEETVEPPDGPSIAMVLRRRQGLGE